MLLPVIHSLRTIRGALSDKNFMPDEKCAENIIALREESEGIIKNYVSACMKNAVFSLSQSHPDISYIEFNVIPSDDPNNKSAALVQISVVNDDGFVMIHPNVDKVSELINKFSSSTFSYEETFEFFNCYKVMASGVVYDSQKKRLGVKI